MRFVGAEGLDNIPKCLGRARDLTFAESVARRATGGLADVVLNCLNADDSIAGARSSGWHEAGARHEQRPWRSLPRSGSTAPLPVAMATDSGSSKERG